MKATQKVAFIVFTAKTALFIEFLRDVILL